MDGDVDVVVGVRNAPPVVLRNNGDGTWLPIQPFADVAEVRAFAWGDLDGDGDPDAALLDDKGQLDVLANLQAGQFQGLPGPKSSAAQGLALAIGDINADGVLARQCRRDPARVFGHRRLE
jgi:hypothetical protein